MEAPYRAGVLRAWKTLAAGVREAIVVAAILSDDLFYVFHPRYLLKYLSNWDRWYMKRRVGGWLHRAVHPPIPDAAGATAVPPSPADQQFSAAAAMAAVLQRRFPLAPHACQTHPASKSTVSSYGSFVECLYCGQRWRLMQECCGKWLPVGARPFPGSDRAPSATPYRAAHARTCTSASSASSATPYSSLAPLTSASAASIMPSAPLEDLDGALLATFVIPE